MLREQASTKAGKAMWRLQVNFLAGLLYNLIQGSRDGKYGELKSSQPNKINSS